MRYMNSVRCYKIKDRLCSIWENILTLNVFSRIYVGCGMRQGALAWVGRCKEKVNLSGVVMFVSGMPLERFMTKIFSSIWYQINRFELFLSLDGETYFHK